MKGAHEPPAVGLVTGLKVVGDALATHSRDGIATNVAHIKDDAMYVVFLAASVIGFGSLASREVVSLKKRRAAATKALRECSTMLDFSGKDKEGTTPSASVGKGKSRKGGGVKVGKEFWGELGYLIRVAVPSAGSRGGQLLGAQFTLLVMRTLLTVRANKVNTFYLTKAISTASWKFWVRWFFNFTGWMASGVVVNSGLRYTESLITIELRAALTKKAHKKYMENNNFYKTAVLRQGGLDNVDQRIVADIEEFSRETAFLYGHSFKPILEFTLSLTEAAKELGYSRPLALFASQIMITGVLRSIAPRLGPMVAREAALEVGFRHTHSRLIAHAEEIALLGGGDREVLGAAQKRSAADFALWKFSKPGEPSWPSPWGEGRPGWHSECVVMSLELLGEGFDLHCGGADLRFPHHENERAQAVALGKQFARHWMHNGFVVDTEGEKMSKSLGNVANLLDLVQHYDPRAYRMLLLQTHYRSPVKVGQDNIDASVNALAGLDGFADRMSKASLPSSEPDAETIARFREVMDNDLDTPGAMAHIFDAVRRSNIAIDEGNSGQASALSLAVLQMCSALGLELRAAAEVDAATMQRASDLDAARAAKDFATADAIRNELQAAGFVVESTKDGTRVRRA